MSSGSDFRHRRHREEVDLLVAISLIVESELRNSMVLANHLPAHADALHQGVAFERVAVERSAKLCFLGGEGVNDLDRLQPGSVAPVLVCVWAEH